MTAVLMRLRAIPPIAMLAAALVLAALLWAVFQHAELYLGHDESIYAMKSRSWLTGDPAAGWGIYRPLGLPLAGFVALAISDTTGAVRVAGLLVNLLAIVLVYAVAARVSTRRRAVVAVVVMISGATFLRRLPEFLDDISSSSLLLVTAYLVLRSRRPELRPATRAQGPPAGEPGDRWRRWALPAAAVTAALTLLMRLGAGAGLVSIVVAAVLVWGPRTWLRAWREVAAAGVAGLLCLLPLAIYSHAVSGSFIGVITRGAATPYQIYVGEGLVYYARSFPLLLAGPVGAIVMTAALVSVFAGALALMRRTTITGGASREQVFLGLAGVIQVLILGIMTHGETRYIYFTVLALTVVGVDAIARWAGARRALVLTATAVLALGATALTTLAVYRTLGHLTAEMRPTATVAAQIRDERAAAVAAGQRLPPCMVITDLHVVAAWISRCDARLPQDRRALPAGVTVYKLDVPGTRAPRGQQAP